ncbi:MAG: PD-(D/E)XK nuclease family protein [Treponema sp.]|nr:PD-(D/E)XK nuclease family protein [Treponema sp.]
MKKLELASIESFFRENIADKNSFFVFPTDIVCQSWAEWCVLDNHTSVKSVAMERFIAWDDFKGKFLSAEKENALAVPSLLRKLFVYDIIRQNSETPFFKKIISPEFASTAYSFADWLEKNLPSLKLWKKRMEENKSEYGQLDEEDQDYEILYQKYCDFLEKNSLFEPAWVEDVHFSNDKYKFYLFYPEQLADYSDFADVFENVDNITAIILPKEEKRPKAYFYKDSRRELRQVGLRIIDLVKSGKADWTEITLSVPDIETYRPYIQREFEEYGIPYIFRAGTSLTKNSAGRIFREIYDCYNSNFSYDSVRSLVLDECIPWKDKIKLNMKAADQEDDFQLFGLKDLREALVREGNRMRCICSYEEFDGQDCRNVDIWEEALGKTFATNKVLLRFYRKLKLSVKRFFSEEAHTFENLLSAWNTFKTTFIEEKDFSSDANKILGRCISHLDELISIERDFKDARLSLENPFQFYLNLLDKKMYSKQNASQGVSVLPYKLTAGAYFKYQFVIDASQRNIEVPFKPLSFLSAEKRRKLKFIDDEKIYNATETILRLYAKNVEEIDNSFVHFSAAENTFSGFAIPHSLLDLENVQADLDDSDFILAERRWLEDGAKSSANLSSRQNEEISTWIDSSINPDRIYRTSSEIQNKIKNLLVTSKNESLKSKDIPVSEKGLSQNKISARGDLEKFFPCPRKWMLSQLLRLNTDTLDTDLMSPYDMGNLHHKVLELFAKNYMNKPLPFYDKDSGRFMKISEDSSILNAESDCTDEVLNLLLGDGSEDNPGVVEKAILHISNDFHDSPLVIKTLLNQKEKVFRSIYDFLSVFLLPYAVDDSVEIPKNINGLGNCIVSAVEGTFISEEEEFSYYGKIDCLLKSPDTKQYILIDYKNTESSIPKEKEFCVDAENGILKNFQMALYCRILSKKGDEILASYFYPIKDASKARMVFDEKTVNATKKTDPVMPFEKFIPTLEVCHEYAKIFNDIVSNPKADYTPETNDDVKNRMNTKSYENCAQCNFKTICRTTYSLAGKQIRTKRD